jgi:hypothetical protein
MSASVVRRSLAMVMKAVFLLALVACCVTTLAKDVQPPLYRPVMSWTPRRLSKQMIPSQRRKSALPVPQLPWLPQLRRSPFNVDLTMMPGK